MDASEVQDAQPASILEQHWLEWHESWSCGIDYDCENDSFFSKLRTIVARDVVLTVPADGLSIHGFSNYAQYMLECSRSVPDVAIATHDVVMVGPRTAAITYSTTGTVICSVAGLPTGKFEGKCVSILTLDAFNKISRECVHILPTDGSLLSASGCQGISDSAPLLASTQSGSRFLQDAIDMTHVDLLEQLRGSVLDTMRSYHANHVLQKHIVAMPQGAAQFIIDELRGQAIVAAKHRTSSRVLERLIEHCSHHQMETCVAELLAAAPCLAKDSFGNFVLQALLEHGCAETRQRLTSTICCDAKSLATHRFSSKLVCCALVHCSQEDQIRLAQAIAPEPQDLSRLERHRCGSFVARAIKQQKLH